jgi:hypothetical protein
MNSPALAVWRACGTAKRSAREGGKNAVPA